MFQACDNVTEIVCDIVPYTKCELEWIDVDYKGYEDVTVPYYPYVCEYGSNIIQHEKMTPKCYNETKLNCITLWKSDEHGKQVFHFQRKQQVKLNFIYLIQLLSYSNYNTVFAFPVYI